MVINKSLELYSKICIKKKKQKNFIIKRSSMDNLTIFQSKSQFKFISTNFAKFYVQKLMVIIFVLFAQPTNIEVAVKNVVEFLENMKETDNVNYNFYLDKLNIKTDLTIILSEGFPPFKLELELELKDQNIVSINCISSQLLW